MKIFAIVPVKKFENSKSRLSTFLSLQDRVQLSSIMLQETMAVLLASDRIQEVIVVSADHRARELANSAGAVFLQEEKDNGVNSAVRIADSYAASQNADASIVIPQDLPLLDIEEVSMACDMAETENQCVVMVPSLRYDGTNLLLRKPPSVIQTFFDNNSYESHLAAAKSKGVPTKLYFSSRLMMDVDTPDDTRLLANDDRGQKSKVAEFFRQKDAERAA